MILVKARHIARTIFRSMAVSGIRTGEESEGPPCPHFSKVPIFAARCSRTRYFEIENRKFCTAHRT